MELDKRIKDTGSILTCFSIEAAKEYLGQQGYFTNTMNELVIETNIEDIEADFKKANSIDNIRSAEELVQLYCSFNSKAFEKVRCRFRTCFNHFWVKFHYKGHEYDLINETNWVLEYASLWILSVENKHPVKEPLAFDVKVLSLGWDKLIGFCIQNNLKDTAIECLLISSLMEFFIPEYKRYLTAVKRLKKNTLMNQLIPGILNGGKAKK